MNGIDDTNVRETIVRETLARLKQELADLGDQGDVLLTYNAQAEFARKQSTLMGRMSTIRRSESILKEVKPKIDADEAWLAQLNDWRSKLVEELHARPVPRTAKERGEEQNLALSIQVIDRSYRVVEGSGYGLEKLRLGALMRESGYVASPPAPGQTFGFLPWLGSVPEVEHRLREMHAKRNDARSRLEAALRDPEPAKV
jgi:hypothetical protein